MYSSSSIIVFSFIMVFQFSGCAKKQEYDIEKFSDALTVGILLEETRAVIPADTVLKEVNPEGLALTKESEGFRKRLYNDSAGYCTIGYGHLIKKSACNNTEELEYRVGITEPRGEEILLIDMNWAKYTVMKAVSVELTQGQYAALVDFVFNVGSGNFNNSTLLKKVNAGHHDNIPSQFRRWVKAGGKAWPGLVTRREKEINLYLKGTAIPRLLPPAGEELPDIDIRLGEVGS